MRLIRIIVTDANESHTASLNENESRLGMT